MSTLENSDIRRLVISSTYPIDQRLVADAVPSLFCLEQNVMSVDLLFMKLVIQVPRVPTGGQRLIPPWQFVDTIWMRLHGVVVEFVILAFAIRGSSHSPDGCQNEEGE